MYVKPRIVSNGKLPICLETGVSGAPVVALTLSECGGLDLILLIRISCHRTAVTEPRTEREGCGASSREAARSLRGC